MALSLKSGSMQFFSWLTFAISLTFYWITADPGVSYWDCPEYVTVASKLEIGHSPGNPIWMLAMRVATIPFAAEHHAYVINLCSGLFMAFAAFFLCRIIYVGLIEASSRGDANKNKNEGRNIFIGFISLCGALCFALCDSAWYSAVEAEVYAMSAFLSVLSLWIMTLWWMEKSKAKRARLMILTAYITGISLGVHQLNLLLVPVFLLAIFYKRYRKRIYPATLILWIAMSVVTVGVLLMIMLPLTLQGAQQFELFGVNSLRLPYNSGTIIFGCLLLIALALLIFIFERTGLRKWSLSLWCLSFILMGFSSYGIIMIRGAASPPLNVGNPGNIFSLNGYISRDQYPKTPLLYGNTPYSMPLFEEDFVDGKPVYNRYLLEKGKGIYKPVMKGAELNYRSRMLTHEDSIRNEEAMESNHGYILTDYSISHKLTPELNMWFPRITSRNTNDRKEYEEWTGMTPDNMEKVAVSETLDSLGKPVTRMNAQGEREEAFSYRPTYLQHLEYFVKYQAFYMYFRYLFWNFIGRQNDYHSTGEIEHGNFITGINPVDALMVGDRSKVPAEIGEGNKGLNRYFGIPFLFGILGIIWLLSGNRQRRRLFSLSFLLFLMTGLAIVAYLNQNPGEARERDYTFLVSYMAFAMWIAAGFMGVSQWLMNLGKSLSSSRQKTIKNPSQIKNWAIPVTCIIAVCPPTLMALENFDDHDRRGRFEPTFYASSLLDFEMPAIIFSHGDNSSFPLWYATEVLDKGKDHTPIDITYLSMPDYVENLKKQGRRGIETLLSTPGMAFGKYVFARIPADTVSPPLPLEEALRGLYESPEGIPAFPTAKVIVPRSSQDSVVIKLRDFTNGSSLMPFKNVMLLDIIAMQLKSDKPKVVYFPSLVEKKFAGPLNSVLTPAIFGKIYAPYLNDSAKYELYRRGVERELKKLSELNLKPHYNEPFIDDRSARYRGELIITANDLMEAGDTLLPLRIVDAIEKFYPYDKLPGGSFTTGDTTFYEGKEYIKLLNNLYELTNESYLEVYAETADSLQNRRYKEWIDYYNSLTKEQRGKLSPRSRRLLIK